MRILAKDKWFGAFLSEIFNGHWMGIHFGVEICVLVIGLIMNQSCAVFFMDHLSAGAIVLSKTSLITHRPEDYRCMVLVSLNNVLDTIEKHCFPFFSISRNMNIIGKQAMRLVVCLIHYINTVFIAELIPS